MGSATNKVKVHAWVINLLLSKRRKNSTTVATTVAAHVVIVSYSPSTK